GEAHGDPGTSGGGMEPSESARTRGLTDVSGECESDLRIMRADGIGPRCGAAPQSIADPAEDRQPLRRPRVCEMACQYAAATQLRNNARAPTSINRAAIRPPYRGIAAGNSAGSEYRRRTQHPPVTGLSFDSKLFRSTARTVRRH